MGKRILIPAVTIVALGAIFAGFYYTQSQATKFDHVGIFTNSYRLKTDGRMLIAFDWEYQMYDPVKEAGKASSPMPITLELKDDQLMAMKGKQTIWSGIPGNAVWSDRYQTLFTLSEKGLSLWNEKEGNKFVHKLGSANNDLSLSLDGESLICNIDEGNTRGKSQIFRLTLKDRQSTVVNHPFLAAVPIEIGPDNYLVTEYDSGSKHALETNNVGLLYRWNSKTGKKDQMKLGGTLTSAVVFNGAVWALRQEEVWNYHLLRASRERDKLEFVRLNSTADKIEQVVPF